MQSFWWSQINAHPLHNSASLQHSNSSSLCLIKGQTTAVHHESWFLSESSKPPPKSQSLPGTEHHSGVDIHTSHFPEAMSSRFTSSPRPPTLSGLISYYVSAPDLCSSSSTTLSQPKISCSFPYSQPLLFAALKLLPLVTR